MENNNQKTLVIFGASDHEEKAARDVATMAGCSIGTATFQGNPVNAGNAYKADSFKADRVNLKTDGNIDWATKVIFFECGEGALGDGFEKDTVTHKLFCDHHRPGDFGFYKPAYKFWEASSIGQLVEELDIQYCFHEDSKLHYIAAGDHCPADAYAGRCPGIDPKKFGLKRLRQIAEFEFSKLTQEQKDNTTVRLMVGAVYDDISNALRTIEGVPEVNGIKDLRPFGEIAQLPEAALKTGQAYMAKIPERGRDRELTGNDKIVLGGHTTPEQVEHFMAWASTLDNKIGEPYGNPTRGFAGIVVGPISKSCPTCREVWACANVNTCPACGIQYPEEG